MVHTTVRPVFTVLRTVLITIAAALASNPAQCQHTALVTTPQTTVRRYICTSCEDTCKVVELTIHLSCVLHYAGTSC